MHDLGYIVVGYGLTAVSVAGYRWRLALRAARANRLIDSARRPVHSGHRS